MTSSDLVERLRVFLMDGVVDEGVVLDAATPLIARNLIDSLSVVVILNFIHAELGVEIPLDELTEDNLQTLSTISDLVLRLKTAQSPS